MATQDLTVILIVSHIASLCLSGSITYFAYQAYQRTGSISMRSLTIGFGIISVGLLFGGGLDIVVGLDFKTSVATQSVFTTIGLTFLTYSLFVDDNPIKIRLES